MNEGTQSLKYRVMPCQSPACNNATESTIMRVSDDGDVEGKRSDAIMRLCVSVE